MSLPELMLRRIMGAFFVIAIVAVVVFALVHLAPGDAAEIVAGEQANETQIAHVRHELGLDQPLLSQFSKWMGNLVRFDLGKSLVSGRSVSASLMAALPPTLSITMLATSISCVVGVALGSLSGIYKNAWIDRLISFVTSLLLAMPSFWIGLILVTFFALNKGWLPATGYVSISSGVYPWLRRLILPALALSAATIAEIARQTRGGVVDALEESYVRTARAKGVNGVALIKRHVIRNAAIPVVTVLGLQIGRLLGGVVVIEAIFGIPGLGTLGINAVQRRDIPLLQGYVLLVAAVVVTVNLIVDLSYLWINPKTRSAVR